MKGKQKQITDCLKAKDKRKALTLWEKVHNLKEWGLVDKSVAQKT
jgi:hypothetical protein